MMALGHLKSEITCGIRHGIDFMCNGIHCSKHSKIQYYCHLDALRWLSGIFVFKNNPYLYVRLRFFAPCVKSMTLNCSFYDLHKRRHCNIEDSELHPSDNVLI